MSALTSGIKGLSRTFSPYKKYTKLSKLRQPLVYLHTSSPWRNNDKKSHELLSDQRFRELVAELEAPVSTNNKETDLFDYLETFKPKKTLLETKSYNQLRSHLNKSFTVRQLADYLEHKGLNKKGKKERLITRIINDGWNVKTEDQVKEERRRKLLDQVTESFPASNHELFFIIGDNGNTIREVEDAFNVDITIDVSGSNYTIQGSSNAVKQAKEAIHSKLDIIHEEISIPDKVKNNPKYEEEVKTILADVSKVSNAYISLDENKFSLACRSREALEKAKALLSLVLLELDVTDKKPLDRSDMTLIQNTESERSLLPIHDTSAMSIYSRRFGWSRISGKKSSNDIESDQYTVLSDEKAENIDLEELKGKLLMPFSDMSNAFLQARFGHVLFRNPDNNNILRPSMNTLLSPSDIKGLLNTRTQFFDTMPPFHLTQSFIPFTLENGFHQRCVRLEYINKALLSNAIPPALKRVLLEFHVNEQGEMTLKQAFGEKQRSVIDILGVSGNIDIRLLAREFDEYSQDKLPNELEEMVNKCKLTGYSELEAPRNWVGQNNNQMTLLDVTFINKKRYLADDNLVTISHIQQQDSGIERTELDVTSRLLNPAITGSNNNSNNRWMSFSDTIYNIASKWQYTSSLYEN